MLHIGLIGDRDEELVAHRAVEQSMARLATVTAEWLGTDTLLDESRLARFHGLWCVPGSPYRDMEGALRAIRFARSSGRPFLGTCGGFQHALIEYARSVLGWADAEHAESAPGVGRSVIVPLACALRGVSGGLELRAGSKLAKAYGMQSIVGTYQCSYGLNPAFEQALTTGALRVAARDEAGDVRAVELEAHPFFVAMLFQPEREVLAGDVAPIIRAFVEAARVAAVG